MQEENYTPWLSVKGAAEYASLSERSIRRLLAGGTITAHRIMRGRILIAKQELDDIIKAATYRPRKGRGMWRR